MNTILIRIEGQLSLIEKNYNEWNLRNDKKSEEVLFGKTVKTKMQILYDKGLFDNYDNADEVLQDYVLIARRRPDLDQIHDDKVIQCIYP